ncbi:discoidin domain-containing protein [Pedobacter borealis]|uniref:discoidin domain-containing protein n=1 Tax=Pedobacter borealis TaxID=475254 RepID=UPI000A800BD7|nr:discoidin domain-containing protein [Pedobacter borealis]
MTRRYSILLILNFLTLLAVGQQKLLSIKQKFDIAIKFSGKNAPELNKVIQHYSQSKKDSLKLKAAYFLIGNMTGHFTYSGNKPKVIEAYINYVAGSRKTAKEKFDGFYIKKFDAVWDSLKADDKRNKPFTNNVFDAKVISADLLIENIDYAFKAWALPWSKHLKFAEFCLYVLPYRFYNEPLESWRPMFMKKFSWLLDSMGKSNDPIKACELVNQELKKIFVFNDKMYESPAALGPKNLLNGLMGKCLDQAGMANFAMRAMGIPVVLEQIPRWATRSMGHEFSSVLGKDGKFIAFLGGEHHPYKYKIINEVAPKIYRNVYAIQDDAFLAEDVESQTISPNFDRFIIDVSNQHIQVSDIKISLKPGQVRTNDEVYLCVFDNRNWKPVYKGILKNNEAIFKDMGLGAVYLPVVFNEAGAQQPISPPIRLDKKKSIQVLQPSKETEAITLTRKYPLSSIKMQWIYLMANGIFEGANKSDFSDAEKLYTIPEPVNPKVKLVKILNPRPFQYLRYIFPKYSYGSLAEISFYSKDQDNNPLMGKLMSSAKVKPTDLKIAFDGNLDNYIYTRNLDDYNDEWIGMDLGKSIEITEVGYIPRNDGNAIRTNMNYELFYWKDNWVSIGSGIFNANGELEYKQVPKGALLLLRNWTEGKEERIFTYENNVQVWW